MKFLIINYRYFVSGGPERYMFNLMDLLEKNGHEVIPYSIKYSKNKESVFSSYFASPLSSEDEVTFKDQKRTVKSTIKTIERSFYSREVYNGLTNLIKDTNPDYAIVLHYLRKLSPAVISSLHNNRIPFVVRLSDFAMVCPNAHLVRKLKICELCLQNNLFESVKNKCVQNSYSASIINYLSLQFQKRKGYFNLISKFYVPSSFTIEKMIEGGWPKEKFIHIPTFVNNQIPISNIKIERKNQIVFFGRIDETKGVHILLKSLNYLKSTTSACEIKCLIIGNSSNEYIKSLKKYVKKYSLTNVEFVGLLDKKSLDVIISESLASVVPSIWYENMPNSLLESLSLGTPVIASNLGSIKEVIKSGFNGYLFEPNNYEDLGLKILDILNLSSVQYNKLILNSYNSIHLNHNSKKHYNEVMELLLSLNR